MTPITHACQFQTMDFRNRLASIRNFAMRSYDSLRPVLEDYRRRRAEARTEDIATYGPYGNDDQISYGGDEIEIAYEEYAGYEANSLLAATRSDN